MKWIMTLLIAFTFPIVAVAAPASGGPLSFEHGKGQLLKGGDTHINLWLPGFLIRSIGKAALKEESERKFLTLMPGNTHVKVLTGRKMTEARMNPSIRRYRKRLTRGRYREMAGLRTGDLDIGIAIKRKRNGKIKFMILLHSRDTFAFLKSKTRFSPRDLALLLQEFS